MFLLALTATLGVTLPGCVDGPWAGGVEFAPAVPEGGLAKAPPREQPASGPWFVDRARDYGLDVVTRLGHPDKPSVLHAMGTGVALFDADADGDLDLFVAPGTDVRDGRVVTAGGPWLFRNDGPGRWADITAGSGLAWTGWAQGTAVADYDADGDLDLFVSQHGPDTLWRNRGDGTFDDVTRAAGICESLWGASAAWGDADGDGWPDLYVTNYLEVDALNPPPLHDHLAGTKVFQGPGMLKGQPDHLWRNRGDGTFEDVAPAAGLDQPDGKGMAALFADLNEDTILDLYVTNDGQANHLFLGTGGGRFREVGVETGAALNSRGEPEGSMGVDLADLDGDGRLDLAYSNFRHEGTHVSRALPGGEFQDVTNASRVGHHTMLDVGWGVVLTDLDDDGWPDLVQANGHVYPNTQDAEYAMPAHWLRNLGEGTFEDATEAWGPSLDAVRSGRSVAVGDLDGDGDLDVVMTTIDGPLRVLINEGVRTRKAASIRLVGRHPNREALGARVEVHAGGRVRIGSVRRGGSYLSVSDVALHFGLGDATAIDRVVVRWPDGSSAEYVDLPVDARLTITQDGSEVVAAPFAPASVSTSSHDSER